ncbi:MAG: hypothetical protein M3Y07_09790 [Acidobacteriota bacterium]|nr:hypothetical protein [Acidobacteriota bacterium]
MTLTSMGRVNVAAPGTPVPLAHDSNSRASKIFVQVIPGLTGKAYVGTPGMNKSTLAGVVRILWPNSTGGFSDQFFLETDDGNDGLPLTEYAIDMDVAGEGVLVSYWTE